MTDHADSFVEQPLALHQLSPLTVTERSLCCALARQLPLPAWLIIGPTAWPVAGGTARPTPCWPLSAERSELSAIPQLASLVGEQAQGVWQPLTVYGLPVSGLVLMTEPPNLAAMIDQLKPLVAAIYSRRMAARQALWQHMLLQVAARYAAGEEREALLTEMFGTFFSLVPQSSHLGAAARVTIPGIPEVYSRAWPLWPDEAHAIELALAITNRAIMQARMLNMAAAGVAHDINNLLTVILGRAQLLELDATEEQAADLQMIATAAEVGADTARRLQRFAQLDQLPMKPVDLAAVARHAVAIARQILAAQHNILVVADLDSQPLAIGEAGLLREAVLGLMLATAQFLPDGGLIRVSNGADEHYVWIEIVDPALPPNNDLHRVSVQTRRAHSIELAIARQIARVHRGHLRISADPAGGTLTQLLIPRVR